MSFRQARRDQSFLLPASVDEWVAADHPARFVWAYVEALDLEELGIRTLPAQLGSPSYPPKELLACWLYGFMVRTRTTRSLERACRESLPFMWLTGLLQPDHVTIWRFYNCYRETMAELFKGTVKTAIKVGMVDFAVQSIDGSKIPVSSNNRLRQKKHLEKLMAQVEKEIAEMEEQECKDDLAHKPSGQTKARACKEDLRSRVRKALAQVEEEEKAQKPQSSKKPVALVSDPDARLMKTRHGWKPAYNAQVLVDSQEQIIVTANVTQDNYDSQQLISLLEQEKQELGRCAQVTLADNGYFSVDNLQRTPAYTDLYVPDKTFDTKLRKAPDFHLSKFAYRAEEDVYICPEGKRLTFLRDTKITSSRNRRRRGRQYQCRECDGCPVRGKCTKSKYGRIITRTDDLLLLERHREKMATEEARELVRLRPPMVEGVFGILKECQGAHRFLTRGLIKVKQEWYLLCAAFNLRKLYLRWAQGLPATA